MKGYGLLIMMVAGIAVYISCCIAIGMMVGSHFGGDDGGTIGVLAGLLIGTFLIGLIMFVVAHIKGDRP